MWVDAKTLLNLTSTKNSFEKYHGQKKPFGFPKSQRNPKIKTNQMSELKETKKTKVVVPYE